MFDVLDGLAFLEVKVEARTSGEQLAKYAAFAAVQKANGNTSLILLGKDTRFVEADCFPDLVTGELPIGKKLSSRLPSIGLKESDVARQLQGMSLHRSSFAQLHGALESEVRRLGGASEGEQVLTNLIGGMRDALVRLGLVAMACP